LIEFLGDTGVPANVVFDNNGDTITQNSHSTHLRLSGIRFTGGGSNTCIKQRAGVIWIHSCEFDNFAIVSESQIPGTLLALDFGLLIPITNCTLGFSADAGATIISQSDVTMTVPVGGQGLFQIGGKGLFGAVGSNGYTVTGIGGSLMTASSGFAFMGSGNQYSIDGLSSFVYADNQSFVKLDEGNTVIINNSGSWVDIRGESYFKDSPDTDWQITNSPGGNLISNGSQIESGALVNTTVPFISILSYFAEANSRYAADNRYTEKYAFTLLGNLPVGYSLNYICGDGIPSVEVPLYIAKSLADVVGMRVYTRTSNGVGQTDIYQIYVNGAVPAIPFGVTITNGNSGTYSTGFVPLVAGDRVSVVFTSAAATTAEDITVAFDVRILE
jgi:hypothetical protein